MPSSGGTVFGKELQNIVKREVMDMVQPDREILLRYYYYYQPIARIAQEMGMSMANVKVRLYRARNVLKSTLSKYLAE